MVLRMIPNFLLPKIQSSNKVGFCSKPVFERCQFLISARLLATLVEIIKSLRRYLNKDPIKYHLQTLTYPHSWSDLF
jgi:arginyl-tRNA--protein-N-Asp/Glu arginylyltransferase